MVSGPIPTRPAASVQTGCNGAGGLQLLREDRFVNLSGLLYFTQNTPIYIQKKNKKKNLRKKPLNCYHGGYTYRLISWLLR